MDFFLKFQLRFYLKNANLNFVYLFPKSLIPILSTVYERNQMQFLERDIGKYVTLYLTELNTSLLPFSYLWFCLCHDDILYSKLSIFYKIKKLPVNLPMVFFRICGQSPTASEKHKQYVKRIPAIAISHDVRHLEKAH